MPLLLRVPGVAPRRTTQLVEMIDLFPTLLELTGVHIAPQPASAPLDGRSLVPLLHDQTSNSSRNLTFTQYPRCCGPHGWTGGCDGTHVFDPSNQCTFTDSSLFYAMGYSVRSLDSRYTRWMRWDGRALAALWDAVLGEELYDHRADQSPFDPDHFENVNEISNPTFALEHQIMVQALRNGPFKFTYI